MATYFNGTAEIEGDGMQTLYIMNPSLYAGYSDAPAQANMAFINPMNLSANGQQHFAGIPLQATDSAARPPPIQMATATHDDLSAVHQGLSPRLHYNLWIPVPSSNSVIARAPRQGLLPLGLSAGGDEAKIVESSKYLKAAQQLLDEVVNVGHGGKAERTDSPMKLDEDADAAGGEGNSGAKRGVHLATTGERQELQMTKAKLANMLDEVEQRYGQYRHQMQIVASSFEAVAGLGSAGTYTALALQTMSKQFQCLRDAISGQIRATSESGEGEEECLGGRNKSVGSRLRYVDQHLRQRRALQQLGMAQYSTWRPQRGLPEHAVSVLRAWLFDHFLHPYPKDSDKHMLAKETGLTRSQVSNWFINARVRLWKPMVEEMYMEETKEQGHNAGRDDQKSSKSEGREHSVSRSASNHHGQSPTRTDKANGFKGNQDDRPAMTIQPSNLGVFDEEPFVQQRMTKARSGGSVLNPMSRHEVEQQDDVSNREVVMEFMDHHGAYREEYAPRVGGNGVSLTLGLPHCESPPLSVSRRATYLSSHSIPLGRRLDINGVGSEEINYFSLSSNSGNNNPSSSHPPNVMYESIDNQNRKRIAAQLIPDYVA